LGTTRATYSFLGLYGLGVELGALEGAGMLVEVSEVVLVVVLIVPAGVGSVAAALVVALGAGVVLIPELAEGLSTTVLESRE
jgi:hypothetical protein